MLPASTIRSLGQKEYEKRKHAALEVEALVRELREASGPPAPNPPAAGRRRAAHCVAAAAAGAGPGIRGWPVHH
jgi:hypothetical protein